MPHHPPCVRRALFAAMALAAAATVASSQSLQQAAASAADIAIGLRKVNTLGSVLYIAAHPDDENTAAISYLSKGRCYRSAYLSVTRGDGGQNLIGSEQGPLLGLVRTQELLAARRIDGGEQFFTRAIDFGYSKNPEETLRVWDAEKVLGDMVWVIRQFRPDVIITRFPTHGDGGHGHHTASAILAGRAFEAAGDAARFPEQLKYVQPWRPRRLAWNSWRPPGSDRQPAEGLLNIDLGTYSPVIGESFTEIAGRSRSQHKSQGFGAPERRGPRLDGFQVLAGDAATRDLFDNIDTTWARIAGSGGVAALLAKAEKEFDFKNPAAIVPTLLRAHAELSKLPREPWVDFKLRELARLIRDAAGLWLEATADRYQAPAGGSVKVAASALLRGDADLEIEPVRVSFSPGIEEKIVPLKVNMTKRWDVEASIPKDAAPSGPHWLQEPPSTGMYTINDAQQIGSPMQAPPLKAEFTIHGGGATLQFDVPVVYRWVDPVQGELVRPVEIAPRLTARFDHRVYLSSGSQPRRIVVRASASAPWKGTLQIKTPAGWTPVPPSADLQLEAGRLEQDIEFHLSPGEGAASGPLRLVMKDPDSGSVSDVRDVILISHPHIPVLTWFPAAESRIVRTEVATVGRNIGYIAGAGDDVAEAIQQLGYSVSELTDADLAQGDLSKYDAIVAGVRAYNARKSLAKVQKRLMDYVEGGGTYVVQYCTTADLLNIPIGPAPFSIGRDRVTVEEAEVSMDDSPHTLLRQPNAIAQSDFQGWVQERGLYFANQWDRRYSTVLSMHDPGEPARLGSVLYMKHGKGVFIYSGLSFFRQLPAGVAGAYRLFANFLSARGSTGAEK